MPNVTNCAFPRYTCSSSSGEGPPSACMKPDICWTTRRIRCLCSLGEYETGINRKSCWGGSAPETQAPSPVPFRP
jgi:hypothetical protein